MKHTSKGALFGLIIAGIISGQLSDGSRAVMGDSGLNRAPCVRDYGRGSH